MSQQDTKERILDAAEGLFARDGFQGTSLRAITARAEVNLASVNYHFGSKDALIEAVFERRLTPLNRERMQRLEQVRRRAEQSGRRPDLRETLAAFIEPTLHFRNACSGAQDFVILVGRALHEPDAALRNTFVGLMRPVFLCLFDNLCRSLPRKSPNTLFWRLQFALGAMGHTLCWAEQMESIPALPDNVDPAPDTATLSDLLLAFISGGMEAP
ncbi:MAG: TetR/AcrR family transcriptional regulator [Desulfuromonadales bacterium]|nr:TetR/AcrR family transcriptional regulator [Desulfuromonadales bacterium]NIS42825.1 TetR/AcrR family transcriptional regulator [Desulfuromonadales bacterium]